MTKRIIDGNLIKNFIVAVLLFAGATKNNSYLTLLGVIMLICLAFLYSVEKFFYLMIAIIPFQGHISFFGVAAMPVIAAVIILKLIGEKKYTFGKNVFCSGIIIFGIEFFNDYFHVSLGSLLAWISIGIVCLYIINYVKIEEMNLFKVSINFGIGVFLAIIANMGGQNLENGTVQRFGSANISLGGAMGIPLYALILTSILIVILLNYELSFAKKCIIGMVMMLINMFALLSISRAYLLGIATILMCCLISLFTKKGAKSFKLISLILLVIVIVVYFNYDGFLEIVGDFQYRIQEHANDNGRTGIWISCIEYLKQNWKALLFGEGIFNYTTIGTELNQGFAMSAHNVVLDTVMAFGVAGSVCYVVLFRWYAVKCKKSLHTKPNIISMMPLITLMIYYMTAGSFRYLKTWLYFMMTIYVMYAYKQGRRVR